MAIWRLRKGQWGQGHENKEGRGTGGGRRGRPGPGLTGPREDSAGRPECHGQGRDAIRFMFYKDCSGVGVENGVGTRGHAGRKAWCLSHSPKGERLLGWPWWWREVEELEKHLDDILKLG